MNTTSWEFPHSRCRAGVARADITPPVGIYHRMWGAATHDQSTGVHRPLTATALALSPLSSTAGAGIVFIALDHCLLWHDEMNALLDQVGAEAGLPRDRIIVFFSHTHAAGLMDLQRQSLPGGDLIPAYLRRLGSTLAESARRASAQAQEANITYGAGRCGLARNRDYLGPVAAGLRVRVQPERVHGRHRADRAGHVG